MGDKVVFRGSTIRYYDGRRSEGGSFIRIHLTSEFTAPVMEAMEWEDPGASCESASLEGDLVGTRIEFHPNDSKLKKHAFALDVNDVSDFKLVRVTEKEVTRRELRFIVVSPSPDAAALVDAYVRAMGDKEAALTVMYSVQETLPLASDKPDTGDPKPANGCTSCENEIDFVDEKKKKHINGVKCTRQVTQTALPGATASTPQPVN
jgi:hypothetical protein